VVSVGKSADGCGDIGVSATGGRHRIDPYLQNIKPRTCVHLLYMYHKLDRSIVQIRQFFRSSIPLMSLLMSPSYVFLVPPLEKSYQDRSISIAQ
jgi:hypothetical protein